MLKLALAFAILIAGCDIKGCPHPGGSRCNGAVIELCEYVEAGAVTAWRTQIDCGDPPYACFDCKGGRAVCYYQSRPETCPAP